MIFSVPPTSNTPHVPVILSFLLSIFWCHSPSVRSLLCLSLCASCLHVLAAPHCKQLESGIPVMSYTPHVPIITSFSPSIFQQHSCHARICLGLSRQQYTTKQTKNRLVSYTKFFYTNRHNLPNLLHPLQLHDLTARPHSTVRLLDLPAPSNSSTSLHAPALGSCSMFQLLPPSIALPLYSCYNISPFLSSTKITSNNNSCKKDLTCMFHALNPSSLFPLLYPPFAN